MRHARQALARQELTQSKAPAKKARPRPQIVKAPEPDCCVLCGGIIRRFDTEVFFIHGRCAPCHEALEEE